MKKFLSVFALAAVFFSALPVESSAAQGRLAFGDFLEKVRAHYPLLKKQRSRVQEAIAARHEASAGFLPRFTGVADWTAGDDPVYVFGTLLKQGAFSESDFDVARLNDPDRRSNVAAGVHGRWVLFDAFDTVSRVRAAGHGVRSAELSEEFARMEVSLVSIEAFYRAVLQENLARLASEVLAASRSDLGEAEALNRQGMVYGADFYAAKMNGGQIERAANRFARDAQSSKVLLNILMGEDPLAERELGYDLEPAPADAPGLRDWLGRAELHRKDLQALEAVVAAAETDAYRERMSFLPVLSAFGSVEENTRGEGRSSGNYLVGLKAELDFFDPARGPRAERASQRLAQALQDKEALRDQIAASVSEEHGRYLTVAADLPVVDRMLEDAARAVEQTEKLYHEGKKSVADLLEIRRAHLETAVQAYETRFYARTAHSRLLFLTGTLDDASAARVADGLRER